MKRQIKFLKQGPSECFPTTVAMLTGLTPRYVIKLMLTGTPYKSWSHFINDWWGNPWRRLDSSCMDKMFQNIQPRVPWMSLGCFKADVFAAGSSPKPEELNLIGRGALTLARRFPISRHIVAYQDGIIYDPMQSGPMLFTDWLPLVTKEDYKIESVVPERKV